MEVKKFNSLAELLLSDKFKNKDLSYCDLSGINLSKFPSSTWKNFVFNHTNFTDTGIKFYPEKLCPNHKEYKTEPFYSIEYCDFTNCDLSYLDSSDIASTSIKGCNFTNTDLDVELYTGFGENIEYGWRGLGYKDYSDITFPQNGKMNATIKQIGSLVNFRTIQNNPSVCFSSKDIYHAIRKELPELSDFISSKKIMEYKLFIDEMLQEDIVRDGKLVELINILTADNNFSDIELIRFFQRVIGNKKFSNTNFSNIPCELLKEVHFYNCEFESIVFPEGFEHSTIDLSNSSTPRVYFPTINPSSWRRLSDNRFGSSRITMHRNLYLELGRSCNGKCKFCRNQYLEPCRYDLEGIKNNLLALGKYLDNIVIGGGEPTLLSKDAYYLKEAFYEHRLKVNWTIFTNASADLDDLVLLGDDFNFNISRHSVSDSTNNKILGVKSLNVDELMTLKKSIFKKITLCATCFKGDGLDSVEKIEDYLSFVDECDINGVLFQTLHKDLDDCKQEDSVLPIEDEIFDEIIIKLQEQGYDVGMPIYSTGDYKMIVAKNGIKTISFKKYITKEELEKEWYQACKRTFDLSMDPSGNVYENWHQSSGKVLLRSQNTNK